MNAADGVVVPFYEASLVPFGGIVHEKALPATRTLHPGRQGLCNLEDLLTPRARTSQRRHIRSPLLKKGVEERKLHDPI